MKDIDVLVIGRSCVDYIAVVDSFPKEDMKVPLELRFIEGGGQGGTSSCCISKLGGKVAYIGKLGNDEEGKFLLKRLIDYGVKTDFIEIVKKGKTPVAYVFVTKSNGNRTIIYEPYSLPNIEIDESIKKLISQSKIILLDPQVTYLCKYFKNIVGKNYKIVYDAEGWRDSIEEMMEVADYFIPSSEFLESCSEYFKKTSLLDKIYELNKMVKGELIVTNGNDGAYYFYNSSLYHISAPYIDVKDTIGAGDNFHAMFALSISRGLDIHKSMKFSVVVASLSCREYGGRKGIPNMKEVINIADKVKVQIIE